MLRNYLLVAIRNLAKNKFFSAINIIGLAIGIAASLLILNYLRYEKSFDNFHVNKDRIFRIPMEVVERGQSAQTFAFTYPAVAGALKNEFPEIEEAIRLRKRTALIRVDDKIVPDLRAFYVDEKIFKVFSFSFLHGMAGTALSELNNAVLTKSTALKLFGIADARGKTFLYQDQVFQVSAVMDDVPDNSHLKFDFLLPYRKYAEIIKLNGGDAENSWHWSDFYTYILLKKGHNASDLQNKLPSFVQRHLGDEMKAEAYEVTFRLQPLTEIHTRSRYDYELEGNGNYAYLDNLAIAGFFILVMAWLNYVNLSTSRSLERAKEVGIRKSIGAHKIELMRQFLTESMLVNAIAIAAGVGLMLVANPYLTQIIGKSLPLPRLDFTFWGRLGLFLLTGAVISGFYPAFVMSSFAPFQALKGQAPAGRGLFRKTLVVVQVSLAILLIAGTIGLLRQMQFMRKQDLGVDIDQTLVLRERVYRDSTSIPAIRSFMTAMRKNASVISITSSTDVPGKEIGGSSGYHRKEATSPKRCRNFEVDDNFFGDYHLQLVSGRGFVIGDEKKPLVVLNETAVRILGFENAEEAINHTIVEDMTNYTVIGVVKDYHQESLQFEYNPTIFFLQEYGWDYYSLKVAGTDMPTVVASAEKTWKQFFPDSPFDYFFLDEFYNAQYRSELTFGTMLSAFTFLGILVAGLGLLGLSSFTVAKRQKEIGVRKVLGATVTQIVSLITREYLILVTISFLIAIPLAGLLVSQWLEGYAFRISLGWWFFVIPFLLILLITLLSVGFQSARAAWNNPVRSLRIE